MNKLQSTNYKLQTNSKFKIQNTGFENLNFNYLILFVIWCLGFGILCLNSANAGSSPQFLISWQSDSYAPSWYQGKNLPAYKSPIEIGFELIDNGKIADLSKTKVRWYINDKLVRNENNGLGIKSLKFAIPDYAGNDTEVRITIVDYRDVGVLDKIVRIPVRGPEMVINAPYPDLKIITGSSVFQAIPFFFNVKNKNNLAVEWSANGKKAEGAFDDPWLLNLNIDSQTPSGFVIHLSAAIRNILNQLETASKTIQLQVK